MIPSIRTFLLINLLLSVTLITSFVVIANLFLEHKEVQNYMDQQLVFRAQTIQAFVSVYANNPKDLQALQNKINTISNPSNTAGPLLFPSYEQFEFQVWKNHQLILASPSSPHCKLSQITRGFHDHWLDGQSWRFYNNYNPNTGLTVVITEKYEARESLETHITRDSILIMLISYPFLGILIWIIVGRGLDSLKRIASEVRNREPGYLEPVDPELAPTEIKPIVEELNELFQRLHEAFDREKRFASDAAHELRTPLAALKAQAQVALKATSDAERIDALRKVVTGVDRAAHVVHQLLTLSRMVPEASHGEAVSVDLAKQAAEVIAELVPEALEKNTEIELDVLKQPQPIHGFPTAITILIRNLIDNAVRYTPENSIIKVMINETDTHILLQVIDNGPGIPEKFRGRVFERFFRILGHKTTGSGLGLGIVQQIAALHNANVILSTPPNGVGLEVTVNFRKASV